MSVILKARSENAVRRALLSVQAMTSDTQMQTVQVVRNTNQMVQLAREGHKESRTLKVLAQSATMFLPPSLIAVRVSTTLKSLAGRFEAIFTLVLLLIEIVNF